MPCTRTVPHALWLVSVELSWGRLSGVLQLQPTRKQYVGVKGYHWLAQAAGREEAKKNCTGQRMEGGGNMSTESTTERKRMEVTMSSLERKSEAHGPGLSVGQGVIMVASQSTQRDPPHGRAPKGLMILFSLASPSLREPRTSQ